MGVVRFYQVKGETPAAVDAVLPRLLDKAMARQPVLVVCGNAARMLRLDESLWNDGDDGFLPHGLAEGPFVEKQPIVLAEAGQVDDALWHVRLPVLLAGAEATLEQAMAAEMVLYVFESSEAVVARAREVWKGLKGREGVSAEYWAQGEKGWEKKAG
ncbi:MAG: DNA polymerase III subunit chi [Pseudomonadaceae bacterium]|nr:DNA polymerase III subunit chi [Pseudomonadaceae bacterium]